MSTQTGRWTYRPSLKSSALSHILFILIIIYFIMNGRPTSAWAFTRIALIAGVTYTASQSTAGVSWALNSTARVNTWKMRCLAKLPDNLNIISSGTALLTSTRTLWRVAFVTGVAITPSLIAIGILRALDGLTGINNWNKEKDENWIIRSKIWKSPYYRFKDTTIIFKFSFLYWHNSIAIAT